MRFWPQFLAKVVDQSKVFLQEHIRHVSLAKPGVTGVVNVLLENIRIFLARSKVVGSGCM